jgi:cell wall-associated NlpC family hydrolase
MLRRVSVPALAVVAVLSSTVLGLARPATGDAISDAKAKAAAIESQLQQAQNEMSALSQQYDQAKYHLSQITSSISSTQANIASDQKQVAQDKATLSKAAVANYISDGSASAQNPIFSGNEATLGATTEYNQIAEGDISLAVDNLHSAESQLNAQENQLQGEQTQAQNQVSVEQNAVAQNQQAISQQTQALSQEQGQIASLVKQQQEAEAAAAAQAAAAKLAAARTAAASAAVATQQHSAGASAAAAPAAASQAAPPPTAAGGLGALQAAESQEGVPYVWGGESPKGSASPGFDCSGLTAWSWGQVGVSLPHYSGAQMADSTPVPISDLQPGDLLFYGPGGSEHVAMYAGPGEMIEAPFTGAVVWVTALRLGNGFVGAGRP